MGWRRHCVLMCLPLSQWSMINRRYSGGVSSSSADYVSVFMYVCRCVRVREAERHIDCKESKWNLKTRIKCELRSRDKCFSYTVEFNWPLRWFILAPLLAIWCQKPLTQAWVSLLVSCVCDTWILACNHTLEKVILWLCSCRSTWR